MITIAKWHLPYRDGKRDMFMLVNAEDLDKNFKEEIPSFIINGKEHDEYRGEFMYLTNHNFRKLTNEEVIKAAIYVGVSNAIKAIRNIKKHYPTKFNM